MLEWTGKYAKESNFLGTIVTQKSKVYYPTTNFVAWVHYPTFTGVRPTTRFASKLVFNFQIFSIYSSTANNTMPRYSCAVYIL